MLVFNISPGISIPVSQFGEFASNAFWCSLPNSGIAADARGTKCKATCALNVWYCLLFGAGKCLHVQPYLLTQDVVKKHVPLR